VESTACYHSNYTVYTEPSSSGQQSKPRDPEIKPNPESSSKKDLLSQPKVEPLSPKNEDVKSTLELSSEEDVKPKNVGLFHYTEQYDELLRNVIAFVITEQTNGKEIKYLKALIYATTLQGNHWIVIALCAQSAVTLLGMFILQLRQ